MIVLVGIICFLVGEFTGLFVAALLMAASQNSRRLDE